MEANKWGFNRKCVYAKRVRIKFFLREMYFPFPFNVLPLLIYFLSYIFCICCWCCVLFMQYIVENEIFFKYYYQVKNVNVFRVNKDYWGRSKRVFVCINWIVEIAIQTSNTCSNKIWNIQNRDLNYSTNNENKYKAIPNAKQWYTILLYIIWFRFLLLPSFAIFVLYHKFYLF